MLSALAGAGIKGAYLASPMLAEAHWQAGDRPLPAPKVTAAGESALLVDPAEIPSSGDVGGHLYAEAPKNRKYRRTIYPRRTPDGYPLAERLAARIEEARTEQKAGTSPHGILFPSSSGAHWRSSNFNRRILQPAYLKTGWRNSTGEGRWTWHSLRHVARRGQRVLAQHS